MAKSATILVVDDEVYVRNSLAEVLQSEGFAVQSAGSLAEAAERLAAAEPDVVLSDLRMSGGDGLELLKFVRRQGYATPVVLMTGVGTLRDAVEAIQGGAYDFLQKPVDSQQLALVLRRALEHRELVREVRTLRSSVREAAGKRELVGQSAALARVRALIDQVGPTDATVLVTGESGTGKELVGEQVHRASARASKSLVRVNCSAVPPTLFESEFFGHRRGAFSGAVSDRVGRFAEAQGGTLVLDEIGTLPPEMQAKLLRVLENGEYQVVGESRTRVADARVIALTNENLPERVAKGEFRADLYYRINVFPIALPPLRTHKEDLPQIADAILAGLRDAGRGPVRLDASALEVLQSYDWPGNVRELRNLLERASIVAGLRPIDAALVRALLEPTLSLSPSAGSDDLNLRRNLDAAEMQLVQRALDRSEGRKKDAAEMLGIDPRNLGYYLRKHGLS
ncbi:MAG: sigma-54-dependent Fis family transcriptional regulator [Planctomycetes bacterium]|nr:sigma-54-dependent Fis family transcriptional regulator [Planctomycetota bacterium]